MKTVGIITMHKVPNVGSALQAYATQRLIEDLGYKAKLIDYKYPNTFHFRRGYPFTSEEQFLPWLIWFDSDAIRYRHWYHPSKRYLKKYLQEILPRILKNKDSEAQVFNLYRLFYKKYFKTTRTYLTNSELMKHTPKFDIYVTGSDQVWNPRFAKGDLSYYLNWIDSKPKIAFSASFSQKTLNQELINTITPLLKDYYAISMREENGVKLANTITGKPATWMPDPTLLLPKESWLKLVPKTSSCEQYILLYLLDYAFDPKPDIFKIADYYSKMLNMKVMYIGSYYKENHLTNFKHISVYGPVEFLSLISNSSMVVTSSFHGTSFAINFLKPLIAFVPSELQDDRQYTLLKKLGIESTIVKVGSSIEDTNPYYDENVLREKLWKMRCSSIEWLRSTLQSAL